MCEGVHMNEWTNVTIFITENVFTTTKCDFFYWTRGLGETVSDIPAVFKCKGNSAGSSWSPSQYWCYCIFVHSSMSTYTALITPTYHVWHSCNSPYLYAIDTWFKSQLQHRLSWQRFSVIFRSSSGKCYLKIGHDMQNIKCSTVRNTPTWFDVTCT